VDRLALVERAVDVAHAHRLAPPRHEMHLYAARALVEEREVIESGRVEVGADDAVDMPQHVAVERGRHAGCVVVGGLQPARILARVGADDDAAAACREAVQVDVRQEAQRVVRREIADRRARIEERGRCIAQIAAQIEAVGEVGDDARERQLGKLRREARKCACERVAGDVDGDVARRREERQPALRLGAVARAQVDELPPVAGRLCDLFAIPGEDRPLGTRRVVFGQLADRAEKRAADAVVKVLGRDRSAGVEEAAGERPAFGGGIARQSIDEPVIRHGGTMLLRQVR
jgi:hypothetical protein